MGTWMSGHGGRTEGYAWGLGPVLPFTKADLAEAGDASLIHAPAETKPRFRAWFCVPPYDRLMTWQLFIMEGAEIHPHQTGAYSGLGCVFLLPTVPLPGSLSISSQNALAAIMALLRALLLIRELRSQRGTHSHGLVCME